MRDHFTIIKRKT